ncbi:unnamed protein product [Moneuplotes crassus]|uniref:Uncharacterized protein n=1 Tax=Euplotes crassus TaxID=5936 RepID=A0AAD1XDF9_EUPCR|nr:unnamed protein product [Moneuplotes crassus]
MAMVSNYGSVVQVAGIGLGVMFINMFIFGAFEGLNGAIDTLVSQYYGVRDYGGCNLTLNRARMINSFMFIPCAIMLALSKEILVFLDQDSEVAIVAQKFLVFQIPGLFVFIQFDTLRRYLQAMGHFNLILKGELVSVGFHVVAISLTLNFIEGDPVIICALICNITMFLSYVCVCYFAKDILDEVNELPVTEGAFDQWWAYLGLALPCAFIICSEWWMYEFLTILTGWIGVRELATIVIIFNTHTFVYDFSYGLSQATSSVIGRTLAECGKEEAKRILAYIGLIEFIMCILMTTIYLLFSTEIIRIFSNEEDIVMMYTDSLFYIIIMFIFDSLQIVIGGVIRGIGEQGESSIVSFISYGLITLPAAIILAFPLEMGMKGIISGYILGVIGNTVMNAYVLFKSDWELKIEDSEDLGFVEI